MAWAIGSRFIAAHDVTLAEFGEPGRRIHAVGAQNLAAIKNDQTQLQSRSKEHAMSKLMMLFVFLMSGALYDPPRFLNHLSDAQAIGWKIKSTFGR